MFKFREFFTTEAEEQDKNFWLEMALGATLGRETITKLPASVYNVLNVLPEDEQSHVLRWIVTEGLRQALVNRKIFANAVSQYLTKQSGRSIEIPQNAIFSPVALQHIPELAAIYDKVEQDWFNKGFEPKDIVLGDEHTRVSLQAINDAIPEGREKLTFGGQNGLINYIETGEWLPQNERYAPPRDGNPWSRSQRGHDLSLGKNNPQGLKQTPDGRVYHCFGLENGFVPSQSDRYWSKLLMVTRRATQTALDNARAKIAAGRADEVPADLARAGDNTLFDQKTLWQPLEKALGMHNKVASVADLDDEGKPIVKNYSEIPERWLQQVDDGLDKGITQALQSTVVLPGTKSLAPASDMQVVLSAGSAPVNPGKTQVIINPGFDFEKTKQDIKDLVFNKSKRLLKLRLSRYVYVQGKKAAHHTLLVDSLLRMGINPAKSEPGGSEDDKLRQGWAPINQYKFKKAGVLSDAMPDPEAITRDQLENMLKNGWVPTNLTDAEEQAMQNVGLEGAPTTYVDALAPDRAFLTVKKPGEPFAKKLRRVGDQWEAQNGRRSLKAGHGTSDPLLTNVLMKQNADLSRMQRIGIGDAESKAAADAVFERLVSNPEEFGEERGRRVNGQYYPQCVVKGVNIGLKGNIRDADLADAACARAYSQLALNAGSAQFKFGELETDKIVTQLITLDGVDEEMADVVIRRIRKDLFSGVDTPIVEGGPPITKQGVRSDVYMALLKNGARWRVNVSATAARTELSEKLSGDPQLGQFEKPGEEGKARGIDPSEEQERKRRAIASGAASGEGVKERKARLQTQQGELFTRPEDEKNYTLFGDTPWPEKQPTLVPMKPRTSPQPKPAPAPAVAAREMPPTSPVQLPPLTGLQRALANRQTQPPLTGLQRILADRRKQAKQAMSVESTLPSFTLWREMMGATGVVYGNSRNKAKLRDGCGFNIEGEPGKIAVSIGGEVNTTKEDPDGTKGIVKRDRQTK